MPLTNSNPKNIVVLTKSLYSFDITADIHAIMVSYHLFVMLVSIFLLTATFIDEMPRQISFLANPCEQKVPVNQ
jgi:hypothetical protein